MDRDNDTNRARQADLPPVPRAGRRRVEWYRAVRHRIAEDVHATVLELLADGLPEDFAADVVTTGVEAFVQAVEAEAAEATVVGRWAA